MIGMSTLSVRNIRRVALAIFLLSVLGIIATLLFGAERNGAQRWISVAGMSLQPSEFLKPALVIVMAWMFAEQNRGSGVPGYWIACGLWAGAVLLLMAQPDFGQTVLLTATFGVMFFVSGMPRILIVMSGAVMALGTMLAYMFVPHVTNRIDRFLNPASGDNYQVDKAVDAFSRGGLLGQGPGEGEVKRVLPDAHTDYIFAVVGEEFGGIVCLLLVGLFAFIVLRGLARVFVSEDNFVQIAAFGLIFLFGMQAAINMGVSLDLLPSKGMTLPFISYGGSSLLAVSLTVGMLLALLRKRAGIGIGGVSVGRGE
jgi:cell division protein FtsW